MQTPDDNFTDWVWVVGSERWLNVQLSLMMTSSFSELQGANWEKGVPTLHLSLFLLVPGKRQDLPRGNVRQSSRGEDSLKFLRAVSSVGRLLSWRGT